MPGRRPFRVLVVLALTGLMATAVSLRAMAATPTSPEKAAKFVQDLGQRAVQLLGNYDEAHAAQHQAEFKSLVRQGFDLDLIGRFVLGNAWRTATPEQQREYQQLFSKWVLDSYARRLGAYKGETFSITGSQPIANTDALVETQIMRPGGQQPLKAGWRVREIDGQMKIIDVVVEGVSMALTQRQEFASVVQREGLDGLITDLRTRLQNLEKSQQS
ncbi:MAG TPA: ABC transporter substrate-binding protein [Alphaproteobacteria bacterium]|nr:ABC transporter substrate-binding protein [Alphaproteobacteria bacterium]